MKKGNKNFKLSNIRERNGFTQQKTADLLHITKQTYNSKENGHTDFTSTEMIKIAKTFNESLDTLFWEEKDNENVKRVI